MKYSPISDCGRDWQKASDLNEPKPFCVTCTVTRAWQVGLPPPSMQSLGRSIDWIFPGSNAGDLEVGAGHQAERVVELDLVRARRGVVVRGSAGDHDERADGEQDRARLRGPVSFAGRDLVGVAGEPGLRVVERAALHRSRAAVALSGGQHLLRELEAVAGFPAGCSAGCRRCSASRSRSSPRPTTGAIRLAPPLASIVPGCV